MTTYQTSRFTTVTRGPGRPKNADKPAAKGMLEIISDPHAGMIMIDACIPLALAARFIAEAEKAGLTVRYPE